MMRLQPVSLAPAVAAARLRPLLLAALTGGAVFVPLLHALLSAHVCGQAAADPTECRRLVVQNVALQLTAGLLLWMLNRAGAGPTPAPGQRVRRQRPGTGRERGSGTGRQTHWPSWAVLRLEQSS